MVRALGYKMIPPLGRTSWLSTALCRNHRFINSVGCCARRERPRGDGAADKRNELAASHAEPLVPRDKLSTPHRMERRAETSSRTTSMGADQTGSVHGKRLSRPQASVSESPFRRMEP